LLAYQQVEERDQEFVMSLHKPHVLAAVMALASIVCYQTSTALPGDDLLNRQSTTAAACVADAYVNARGLGANYDLFMPMIASHCQGTNHQDIDGIERVVFLGDSITVGTPPTPWEIYYRSQLADVLATQFDLTYGVLEQLWKPFNPVDGTALVREAGDFASCARWGARNEDLLQDDTQLETCFPVDKRDRRTLVIITSGGNDLAKLTRSAMDGATTDELWTQTQSFVQDLRDAINWLVAEPPKFPHGIFVIFANLYEFTDGTGEAPACDTSALAGFDEPAPLHLLDMFVWANEQYLNLAVETGTDMVFMSEAFCGHGFNRDDPTSPCYRGPGTEPWFDLTCLHPNPTGHIELARMFLSVVNE
jgi:lysophospholipase L1-like esterase